MYVCPCLAHIIIYFCFLAFENIRYKVLLLLNIMLYFLKNKCFYKTIVEYIITLGHGSAVVYILYSNFTYCPTNILCNISFSDWYLIPYHITFHWPLFLVS